MNALASVAPPRHGGRIIRHRRRLCRPYKPRVADVLDRLAEFDFFRGTRQEAWYDASQPHSAMEHDVDLLRHPNWIKGLNELAQRNLTFDLFVYGHQLRLAADTFSNIPDLAVVIDHLGLPASAVDDQSWRDDLRYFQERVPNAHMKPSGLSFVAPTLQDLAIEKYVHEALEIFWGRLAATPTSGIRFETLTRGLRETEQSQIFARTTEDFHSINSSRGM